GEYGQLAAAAHGEAFDRRDDRYRAVEHARGPLLEDVVLGAPGLVAHALALLEVAADAEGLLAGAGEDHGAHRPLPLEGLEAVEQLLAHRRVHGIERLGSIQLDGDDEAVGRARDVERPIAG